MLLLYVAAHIVMSRMTLGRYIYAVGGNAEAARLAGVNVRRVRLLVYTVCGALAGLGGAVQVSAIMHRLYESLSPGWGYEAIAVALVARLNPLGVMLTALLFGALDNGSQAMQRSQGISPVLVQVIQGMVILILLAFDTRAWAGLSDALWRDGGVVAHEANVAARSGSDA